MRVEPYGVIVLSRRNLLALLAKLDDPMSSRTLIGPGNCAAVRAEEDSVHYAHESRKGNGPGRMHPDVEEFIAQYGATVGSTPIETECECGGIKGHRYACTYNSGPAPESPDGRYRD